MIKALAAAEGNELPEEKLNTAVTEKRKWIVGRAGGREQRGKR